MTVEMNSVTQNYFIANWPKDLAPTAESQMFETIWNVVSVILFPIGVSRLVYRQFQSLAGRLIHPASGYSNPYYADYLNNRRLALQEAGGEETSFKTPDGETINAMLFRGSGRHKSAIVKSFGNAACYELSGKRFVSFVRKHVGDDIDVLLVNSRGCMKSSGSSSPAGLALDVYSAGEYLVEEEKKSPGSILFTGHSLGGYSAVAGAALFQKEHPEDNISALSHHSFSTLSEAVEKIVGIIASWLITILNWELDARAGWEQLKGHKIVVYDKKDMIPYETSFHNYVKKSGEEERIFEVEMHSEPSEDAHNRDFTEEEAAEIGRYMRMALESTY